jgi:hypothetical protein
LLAGARSIGEFLSAEARYLTIHAPVSDFQTKLGLMERRRTRGACVRARRMALARCCARCRGHDRRCAHVVFFALADCGFPAVVAVYAEWFVVAEIGLGRRHFLAAAMLVLFDAAGVGECEGAKIVGSSLLPSPSCAK